MQLSEAIRLGAMLGPQAYGRLEDIRYAVRETQFFGTIIVLRKAYCALGGAFEAAGCATRSAVEDGQIQPFRGTANAIGSPVSIIETPRAWLPVLWVMVHCPLCGCAESGEWRNTQPLHRVIAHLNDDHHWSREEIATFVSGAESLILEGSSVPALEMGSVRHE